MNTVDDRFDDQAEPEDETRFPCACGDADCVGRTDDPANIRIGSAWYSADCAMANHHPLVVAAREHDDAMNRTRR